MLNITLLVVRFWICRYSEQLILNVSLLVVTVW